MMARLAFSVATVVNPQILIVDGYCPWATRHFKPRAVRG